MKNWTYRLRSALGAWVLPSVRLVNAERVQQLGDDFITRDDDPVYIRAAVFQFPEVIKLRELYQLSKDFPEHIVAGYKNPVFRIVQKDGVEVE